MKKQTIIITGANGFLGSALCRRFAAEGWNVRAGVRNSRWFLPMGENVVSFVCNLPDELDEAAFAGADVCIHAAYVTRYSTLADAKRVNIGGTARMLQAARRAKIPQFVFVSSCSAHDRAEGFYGRSKFYLESKLDPERDLVIRPGLVLGHGGLFARMVKSIRYSKFIPLFDRGRQELQTIHIDDLVEAISRAVDRKTTGTLILAHPDSVSIREFMREVASRLGYKTRFFSFSIKRALRIIQFLERHNLRLPFSSENLLGLRSMRYQDPRESLKRLRLKLRTTQASLDLLFSQDTVPGKSLTSRRKKAMQRGV